VAQSDWQFSGSGEPLHRLQQTMQAAFAYAEIL
jgi:hypothetical protein